MIMEITWTDCGGLYEPPKRGIQRLVVKGETWQEALQKAIYEVEALSSHRKVIDIRPRVIDF